MYLATRRIGESSNYQIRQSYLDPASGCFHHRLIFDLGENPADHMELMGEVAILFNSALESAVSAHTDADAGTLLEKLLWDFMPLHTREQLSRFDRSGRYIPRPLSQEDIDKIDHQMHIFDRRRLYYLHYGAISQSRLFRMRKTAFRPLFDQSRDEREYYFAEMEKSLEPGEYRNYLYAIFDLQSHFTASFASYLPEALPQDEVADHFIEALCLLNSASSFWQDDEAITPSLHPHLVRYLILFFDFSPRNHSFADEYIRQFINSHRTFRWPEHTPTVSEEKIIDIFGLSLAQLKKLTGKDLTRLYRQKAMEFHPDLGGDQDRFVELTEVYKSLLQRT